MPELIIRIAPRAAGGRRGARRCGFGERLEWRHGVEEVAMTHKAQCGPERDPEFFRELDAVFAKHPDSSRRYAVRCLATEVEVLKVDFTKQVGVSRIEGDRIVTEFRSREDFIDGGEDEPACCEWIGESPHKTCAVYCKV
ncbi:hypothetical protein [Kitasatospora sp. NPDC059673]|uniref:hypothetical protein n=1 Tax=Kitasatospora sp. NPDC059673 TaxID=3346901 RepID=UPI00368F3143